MTTGAEEQETNSENNLILMKAFPIKGENGNYIYFPNEKDTVINANKFSTEFMGLNVDNKEKVICRFLNPEVIKINPQKINLLIEASKLLKHENITKTYDIIIEGQNIILIQEYYEHFTLKDLIYNRQLKHTKYDIFFIKIIIQTLIALEFLHTNKICHCNICPENILIYHYYNGRPNFDEPEVKLTDLDSIKLNYSSMFSYWEEHKTFRLLYASPEQILNLENLVGPQSDIYSMGMVLYETIAKKHLMSEQKNNFYIKRMQYSTPLNNSHNIEDSMFDIIKKACAKKEFIKSSRYYSKHEKTEIVKTGIDHRFKSAKELGLALIKYMEYHNYKV